MITDIDTDTHTVTVDNDGEENAQTIPWGIRRTNACDAAEIVNDNDEAEVDVAILDTVFDKDHPDLSKNVNWTDSMLPPEVDSSHHGTHVAGTVGAVDNNIGVVGVASKSDLYLIKVLTDKADYNEDAEDIAEGIRNATQGPDEEVGTADDTEVISMSFGGGYPQNMYKIENAVEYTYNHGTVLSSLRTAYNLRSRLVHGDRAMGESGESGRIHVNGKHLKIEVFVEKIEDLLRNTLKKAIERENRDSLIDEIDASIWKEFSMSPLFKRESSFF